jgi:hypothetical protein
MRMIQKVRSLSTLSLTLGLAAGLMATGCDRAESPAPAAPQQEQPALTPQQQAAFTKEAMAIKAEYNDPAAAFNQKAFDAAMIELMQRYHLPVPKAAQEAWSPLVPEYVPESGSAELAGALGKEAALTTVWKKVKALDITFPYAQVAVFKVKNTDVMTTWTVGIDPSVDPYLVAFYSTSGRWDRDAIKVIALNDDGHGFPNASIQWGNNTGADRMVALVAFGFSATTTGRSQLKYISTSGGPITTITGRIATSRVFSNNNVITAGCSGPFATRLEEKRISGGRYGTGILGVDVAQMKGANIFDRDTTVDLGFVLKPSGGNFVLPYLEDFDGKTYPNGNHYNGWQEDRYTCDVF